MILGEKICNNNDNNEYDSNDRGCFRELLALIVDPDAMLVGIKCTTKLPCFVSGERREQSL